MSRRPKVHIKPYDWKASDGAATPGIGIHHHGVTIAHYTIAEAITLADRLVDLAEQMEKEES
ncbi:hypothetical protein [Arthrobacter sp. A5]|uniref:hypothetical protein n=1 Tax=Arthrobacter sp. A5 TaxID=576926 RepID=UPI003DA94C43